jgi:hypothetical protein
MQYFIFLCFISIFCSLQAMQLDYARGIEEYLENEYEQQRILLWTFDQAVSKPTLENVYTKLSAVQQTKPATFETMKKRDETSELMIRMGDLPTEMHSEILDYCSGGNGKELLQKMNADSYGNAMFKLSRALAVHKKVPRLHIHELYDHNIAPCGNDAPTEAHVLLYDLIKNGWLDKKTLKLSLHEESLVQKYIPQGAMEICSKVEVACQLPYKDRIVLAIKNGVSCGSKAPFYGYWTALIAAVTTRAIPSTTPIARFLIHPDIFKNQPDIVRYTAGVPVLLFASLAEGITDFANNLLKMPATYEDLLVAHVMLHTIGLVMTLHHYKNTGSFSSEDAMDATSCSLAAVPLGVGYGIASSLIDSATTYPVIKTIGDIKQAENKHP